MSFENPVSDDFKNYFDRDFPYGEDDDLTKVRTKDIDRAIDEASSNINQELFGDQSVYTMAFLYLTAHFLCNDLLSSSQGINSSYDWLTSSKSVGNVSQSFIIPEWIQNDPYLSFLSTTRYGNKYLSFILPLIRGGFAFIDGTSTNV